MFPEVSAADLLAPIDPQTFVTMWSGRRPLKLDGSKALARGQICNLDISRELLLTGALLLERVALLKQGNIVPPAKDEFGVFVDGGLVLSGFERGYTIRILEIETYWPHIRSLCRDLETLLKCEVSANLYLTPPYEQGSRLHYDDHDVFVVQCEGEKTWTIAKSRNTPGIWANANELPGDAAVNLATHTATPGDVLYIPRGHAHFAKTTHSASVHVTFGIRVATWRDTLQAAVDAVALCKPSLTDTLPLGSSGVHFIAQFQQQVWEFAKVATALPFCESMVYQAMRNVEPVTMANHSHVGLDAVRSVRKLPDLQYTLRIRNDCALLTVGPRELCLPSTCAEALQIITSAKSSDAIPTRTIRNSVEDQLADELLGCLLAFGVILVCEKDVTD